MLQLHLAPDPGALLDALARTLRAIRDRGAHPLDPLRVVAPSRGGRAIEHGLAERLGVVGHLVARRPEGLLAELTERAGAKLLDRGLAEALALAVLLDDDAVRREGLTDVATYLSADAITKDLRRAQLARLAGQLFIRYAYDRPEWLAAWATAPEPGDPAGRWQRALWREAAALARRALPRPLWTPLELCEALEKETPRQSSPLHVVATSRLAPVALRGLTAIARAAEVHAYLLDPGAGSADALGGWLEPARMVARACSGQPRRARASGMARRPAPCADAERDGGERAAAAPRAATVLDALKARLRGEDVRPPELDDGTVQVLACPAARREAEAIADATWALVEASEAPGRTPLRLHQVGVRIADRERPLYLSHLAGAFAECHQLPFNASDVPLRALSPVVEAATLLVELPLGVLTRHDVLRVATHPVVLRTAPGAEPDDAARLCDRLGIFRGLDRGDLEGTYVDRDVHSWDQGLRRAALGAFLTGEDDGDARTFDHEDERYLAEPPGGEGPEVHARLGLLLRSLLADCRTARESRLTLSGWAAFLSRIALAYIVPEGPAEENEHRLVQATLHDLADREIEPREVPYTVAAEIARAGLTGLSGAVGQYLADGVVIEPCAPMRLAPFRAIFVCGLGEGRMSGGARPRPLDLAAREPREGDVDDLALERLALAESILGASETVILSYVARDEQTGDELEPAGAVRAILAWAQSEGLDIARMVPLRRHEALDAQSAPRLAPPTAPDAPWEARARAVGEHLRRAGAAPNLEALSREPVLADVLSTIAIPEREPEPKAGPIRLSISALRRFLECPMQAWARTVVGLDAEDDDDAAPREDEPFQPERLQLVITLREVLHATLRGEGDPGTLYDDRTARLEARGRWPTGPARRARRSRDLETIGRWIALLRRRYAQGGAPHVVRFGAGTEHGVAEEVHPALRLRVPADREGRERVVELVGGTLPLVSDPSGLLTPIDKPAPSDIAGRLERGRRLLRAYLDHLALTASGARPPEARWALMLYAGGHEPRDASIWLRDLDAPTALSALSDLAADLLDGPHDRLLPCEAVIRSLGGPLPSPTQILNDLSRTLRYDRGGSSRFGPVPRPLERTRPTLEEVGALAERRFGLLYEIVREGIR